MKSFFKFLSKNKLYTFIEVFGLSIALAFVILIFNYVRNEYTMDEFQKNGDNIFILGDDGETNSYGLPGYLINRYPEIESICAYTKNTDPNICKIQDEWITVQTSAVDSNFFQMFSFELTEGAPETVLMGKDNIVISQTFANSYFPGKNPIGQTIWLKEDLAFTVSGVMKDVSHSIIRYADIFFRADNIEYWDEYVTSKSLGNAGGVILFVQQKPGCDLASRKADMLSYFKTFNWHYKEGFSNSVMLIPLKEYYFSGIDSMKWLHSGNKTIVNILLFSCLLILIFAIINYINLTIAQTGFQAKEMATRRLLGSSQLSIIGRYIAEALLFSFVTFATGFLLACILQQPVEDLLQGAIPLLKNSSWITLFFYLLIILVCGLLSGIIPALMVSRYTPMDIVKGNFSMKSKIKITPILIILQITLSMIMIAWTIGVFMQFKHLVNLPMGYDVSDIVYIEQFVKEGTNNRQVFRDELMKLPGVESVGFTEGNPVSQYGVKCRAVFCHGKTIPLMNLIGDSLAFRMFRFSILQQNSDMFAGSYWLTQKALANFELKDTAKEIIDVEGIHIMNGKASICGILQDYHRESALQQDLPNQSELFRMMDDRSSASAIVVKTIGDHAEALKAIQQLMNTLNEKKPKVFYLSDEQRGYYSQIERTTIIIAIFSLIAIVISALGLLAMSTYYTKQRMTEIAISKVYGSSSLEIFFKVSLKFIRLVFISFVISCPIGWSLVNYWLQGYSERIDCSPLFFIISGIFILLVAFAVISWQSVKAAHSNPIQSLHGE